jgi:hypothetical protein
MLSNSLAIGSLSQSRQTQPKYLLVSWLSLAGSLLPAHELNVRLGVNLPPNRLLIILLFVPAILTIFRSGLRATATDIFVLGTVSWMLAASISVSGSAALSSAAGGESIEFLGAYLVGRAFLWRERALSTFVRMLAAVVLLLFILALADRISGQWIAHNTLASIFHVIPAGANFRNGVIRATATLDHPILLATLFAVASTLFLFSALPYMQKLTLVIVCLTGCILALSSAGIMAWLIGLASATYDRALRSLRRRWTLFWAILASMFVAIFLVTNAPLGWIITHLTLDPQSGYFRYLIWNLAIERISEAPWIGYAFNPLNDYILDTTVDSVWLVTALHYGIPAAVFLLLANIAAIWPISTVRDRERPAYPYRINTGLAVALCLFLFVGLTVHFWNYIWAFWGLCIGIKASLRQHTQHCPNPVLCSTKYLSGRAIRLRL